MSNLVQNVKVVPYGDDHYAILGEDGKYFYTTRDEVRVFRLPGDASYFLKCACDQYETLGYRVLLPSGRTRLLGTAKDGGEENFGPHVWNKANLVTASDSSGLYDTYQCMFCGRKEKAYGLHGHAHKTGICRKNPRRIV